MLMVTAENPRGDRAVVNTRGDSFLRVIRGGFEDEQSERDDDYDDKPFPTIGLIPPAARRFWHSFTIPRRGAGWKN